MANQPSKYSKFLVGAASAALVASAVAPIASAADFKDTKGNTHEEAINALSDSGVIKGYSDGTFLPNKTLTRSDVVKMMGKWLVTEGHVIPADARTNPRFTDLSTKTNAELLDYAAVVKDAGVFIGSNGKLLATDNITRENMALVLVRAFDTVNEINLVEYVNAQEFKKDVKDLSAAKKEAQDAINVLDFFDITNPAVASFNPKGNTTRGHFATFLNKSINTDFSLVSGVVTGAVKAINATTVEVTFKDAVENVSDFTIEGLTVSNAAVKQTDNKVVVLTTAVQEGGKKYTVSHAGKEIGSFEGISAVVPTKIDFTKQSVQGKVGQQVVLSADVGVKQAGIPVTFNVKANTIGTLNKDQVFEAITNADGIATFSYTQYSAGNDAVVAYPTGAPSVRSLGYVFWGVETSLIVEDVTKETTINNGANKTYKVKYVSPTTGKPVANEKFLVSFEENINVNANQLANAKVNNVSPSQLLNGTKPDAAVITTDAKGEATFTVTGENTAATPVVFRESVKDSREYKEDVLQVSASKVTFGAIQADYKIEMTRDGVEEAARWAANGREYNIVVKDKDGKIAKNETVNIAFNEDLDGVISTQTEAKFIDVDDNDVQFYFSGAKAKQISVVTDSKGEASFIIGSDKVNDYATPVAWIDVNSSNAIEGKLDKGEATTVADISYFADAKLAGAALATYNAAGKKTTNIDAAQPATFKVALTNQSGKEIGLNSVGYSHIEASFTVFNTGANDVKVGTQTISPNRSYTIPATSVNGDSITVTAIEGKSTSVRVVANGVAKSNLNTVRDYNFTSTESTAKFTASTDVADLYTGDVKSYNTKKETITFDGKNAIAYAGKTGYTYKYFGGNGAQLADKADFIKVLNDAAGSVRVTYKVDTDNAVTFSIVSFGSGAKPINENAGDAAVAEAKKALTDATAAANKTITDAVEGTEVGQYKVGSKAVYQVAVDAATTAAAKADATVATLDAAKAALATATTAFEADKVKEEVVAEFKFTATKTFDSNKNEVLEVYSYNVEGTVANAAAGTEVTFTFSNGTDSKVAKETVTVDGSFKHAKVGNWLEDDATAYGDYTTVVVTYTDKDGVAKTKEASITIK